MKALMSVGALIGVVGLLMLIGMIFGVVPSNTVRLVEGYMPMQVLSELAIFVAGFTGLSYMLNVMGIAFPRFWQGILFWVFIMTYLKFRIYPPIPFSVRAMYGTVSFVAVFMWVSANEEDWKKFQTAYIECARCPHGIPQGASHNVSDTLAAPHRWLLVFDDEAQRR